jgi:hypothetical protein
MGGMGPRWVLRLSLSLSFQSHFGSTSGKSIAMQSKACELIASYVVLRNYGPKHTLAICYSLLVFWA